MRIGRPSRLVRGYTVTFETKCWEGDWNFLLLEGRLEQMIRQCDYAFDNIVLYVNNVKNPEQVKIRAKFLQEQGLIRSFVLVSDYADEALSFFGIDKESFGGGYYYSVQELVGIYLCNTDFLLHFSGDSIIQNKADWIDPAINRMQANSRLFVANPSWDPAFNGPHIESDFEDEQFYFGYGFSDQCYLIKPSSFKRRIYDEWNPASERYPRRGMPTFEKRVDSYMRNHQWLRMTSKKAIYVHEVSPSGPAIPDVQ